MIFLKTGGPAGWADCIEAYETCNMINLIPIELTGINLYDIRIKCEVPPLCTWAVLRVLFNRSICIMNTSCTQ